MFGKVIFIKVFNGIDRDSKKCILITFEDRTVDTLVKLVKQHIKPGTTIISDCGRAYSSLNSEDLTHFTVNHSVNFIYSDFGAHTTRNTVSNAHKMIPPAPPCFVWQSPCFALGNLNIIQIKI